MQIDHAPLVVNTGTFNIYNFLLIKYIHKLLHVLDTLRSESSHADVHTDLYQSFNKNT